MPVALTSRVAVGRPDATAQAHVRDKRRLSPRAGRASWSHA